MPVQDTDNTLFFTELFRSIVNSVYSALPGQTLSKADIVEMQGAIKMHQLIPLALDVMGQNSPAFMANRADNRSTVMINTSDWGGVVVTDDPGLADDVQDVVDQYPGGVPVQVDGSQGGMLTGGAPMASPLQLLPVLCVAVLSWLVAQ